MKIHKSGLTIIFIFCTFLNIHAQENDLKDLYRDVTTAINSTLLTKQGVIELSGFLSYNYIKTDFDNNMQATQNMIQIEPQFSYFIMDNISLGLLLSHAYNKSEYEQLTLRSEQTAAGAGIRMYFAEDRLRPFIFTNYLFMFGDAEGSEIDLGAAIFYHVSGNFGVNFFGKYGIIWPDASNIDSQNRFFFGIGLSNFLL